MISKAFVRNMAGYNHWQNQSLVRAADSLSPADRLMERGAFFGSLEGTLNHVLWADTMWMARFQGVEAPSLKIAQSPAFTKEWVSYKEGRAAMDARIIAWATELSEDWLQGSMTWHSRATGREESKPHGEVVVHFFNHQTHHRGQVHAMLTAAGARLEDTDLFVMPARYLV